MKYSIATRFLMFAIGMINLCGGSSAFAANANWNVTTAGNWTVDTNWTAAHPNGIDEVAGLTNNIGTARTVTLDAAQTIGTLNIGDSTSSFVAFTLAGNPLTFDVSTGNAAINKSVSTATDVISAPLLLNDSLDLTVNNGPLTISGAISSDGIAPRSLTKLGTNNVNLSGVNSYSGDTIINAGTVTISGGSALPDGPGKGNVSIASGATLSVVTTNNERINGLTGLGTLALTNRAFVVGGNNVSSTFSGPITSTSSTVGTFQKTGTGVTTLDGVAKSMGLIRVNQYGGNLRLDYGTVASNFISSGTRLQLTGGTVELVGNATGATTQSFADLTMGANAGHDNSIKFTQNGGTGIGLTFSTGQITRAIGVGVNFDGLSASNTVTTSSATATTNGLLNAYTANTGGTNSASGYAVVNGSTWATVSGLNIVGLASGSYTTSSSLLNSAASYNGLSGVASNIDVDNSATPDAAITVNSLRFNTPGANILTLQGTNNLNSGGLLVTSAVGSNPTLITGGTLVGKAGGLSTPLANFVTVAGIPVVSDLIIHQYNTGGILDIDSLITDGPSVATLTKVGPGTLKLSNTSNSYSGLNYIAGGTLQIGAASTATTGVIPHGTGKGGVYLQATLDLNGFDTTLNAIIVNATGKVTNSVAGPVNLTIGDANGVGSANIGTIEDGSGVVSLTKIGTGDYAASSTATYSGGTSINGGTVSLQVDSTGSSGPLGTGTVTLNGGTMINDAFPRTLNNAINVVADTVMVGNSNTNPLRLTGAITGAGMLDATTAAAEYIDYLGDISGFTGTFRIGGASTNNRVHFVGTTTASMDGSTATFDASSTATTGNAVFRWGSAGNTVLKIGELKGTSTVNSFLAIASLGTATLEVGNKNTNSSFAGLIADGTGTAVSFTKVGTGTLTMSGAQPYTGNTTVSGGTLDVTGSLMGNGADKVFIAAPDNSLSGNPLLNRAIASATSYANYGSTEVGGLNSNVQLLAGTSSAATTLSMQWRLRTDAEKSVAEGGNPGSPPMGVLGMSGLVSDVVDINGLGTDLYVLQMQYDETKLVNPEAVLTAAHALYLGSFNTGSGLWENAVADNTGNNASPDQHSFAGSFSAFQATYGTTLTDYIGAWGVDTTSNVTWAVVNHNSEFAVVPEPNSLALSSIALLGIAGLARRKRTR